MNRKNNNAKKTELVANWQTLMRVFIRPENEETKLILLKYMEQILFGLHNFLKKHVGITEEISLKELSMRFTDTTINKDPEKKLAEVITELIEDIAPHAVNVASPYFVGHMTSAIPFFMVHLKTIVTALNQNLVKIETSKIVSILEKQVIAKIHRIIYKENESFYKEHVQNAETTLGCFTKDGTLANITALWVARDSLLVSKEGFPVIEEKGIAPAYKEYGIERCVILTSRLGHYSLKKAGGILGIGNQNIIGIDVDTNNRINLDLLNKEIKKIKQTGGRIRILAVVGIAGTTETGTIDPLKEIGMLCSENKIHFHVDAAWGGPTLMSGKYRHLLDGIALADSVTIDCHKQFYMPMSSGMVYFKNPAIMNSIEYHANYVNRPGSVDLGIKSITGSREANSIILDCALKIMGTRGYALLIEHGIETARKFAEEIKKRPDFQLITPPELNLLTYRICPADIREKLSKDNFEQRQSINEKLNEINRTVQRLQREAGKSFVSRTTLSIGNKRKEDIVVLRCVIMNPMTNINILKKILDEQEEIYRCHIDEF